MPAIPENAPDATAHPEWRRLIRSRYDKEIVLRLEDGTLLAGQARDMNARGFFLFVDPSALNALMEGMTGSFLEDLQGERITIPCRIARITPSGVGVRFLDEEEA
ncbi:MAG: PilZ domain-containing protein [Magnetococcales bacterium]|nr:PilZ domain-containing protein [Magnetococcales bacterium]